jgi:hypothetical protein
MQPVYDVIGQEMSLKEKFQTLEKIAVQRRESDPELAMVMSKKMV